MPRLPGLLAASAFIVLGANLPAHGADLLEVYKQAQQGDVVYAAARAAWTAAQEKLPQGRSGLLPKVDGYIAGLDQIDHYALILASRSALTTWRSLFDGLSAVGRWVLAGTLASLSAITMVPLLACWNTWIAMTSASGAMPLVVPSTNGRFAHGCQPD